jgi:TolA protein
VEPPKAVAKPIEPAKPPPPAKPASADSRPAADVPKKAAESAKGETAAQREAQQRDGAITAAVQRRAAQVPAGTGTTSQDLDKQIAAAVQRRAQQAGSGSGGVAPGPGGPISVGPGSGAGGTPADLEYILYHGRMIERIKAAWAWAGADKTLRAVIQFNLTPEGEIKNVHTVEPSGDARYDASCERAVRAVNPLEPVPEKYRKDFSTFELTFQASDLES